MNYTVNFSREMANAYFARMRTTFNVAAECFESQDHKNHDIAVVCFRHCLEELSLIGANTFFLPCVENDFYRIRSATINCFRIVRGGRLDEVTLRAALSEMV